MTKDVRRKADATTTWARLGAMPASADRVPLTRDEIVATAIRLVDAEGLDAFSMRRLGTELGAGATTLYWHVRSKDELIDLVLDVVIGEVVEDFDAHVAADADWREQLAEVARSLRRVLLRHAPIAPLLGERPTIGPRALDAAERVMGILVDAGFDHRTTALASGALINYATGFAVFESRTPGGSSDAREAQEMVEAVMAYYAALPTERYPIMRTIAGIPFTETEQFEYGLQRLLDGLVADLADPSGRRPSEAPSGDDQPGNALLRH